MTVQPSEQRYRDADATMWAHQGITPTEQSVGIDGVRRRMRALEHGEARLLEQWWMQKQR